jgi:hypothetical protein
MYFALGTILNYYFYRRMGHAVKRLNVKRMRKEHAIRSLEGDVSIIIRRHKKG